MNLDVLIPSLLLPAPIHQPSTPPIAPALQRLLARADPQSDRVPSVVSWLCERWGVGAPYPVAPLLAEFDGLDASNDGWMFAEPVHLVPDRDRLKLYPARFLELSAGETAELIAKLNSHFADRHLTFFAPTADRWYVRCASTEIPDTTPPEVTRFGSLADFQPKSRATLDWRSLQNEAQMLLFDHPVNVARDVLGKPLVSGVWFWGGGVLPDLKKSDFDCVVARPGLATLLAKKTGIEVQALSWSSIQSAQGHVLAVMESLAGFASDWDAPAWEPELARLDKEWFQPISQAINAGVIRHLNIYVPDGERTLSFCLTRRSYLLRFWRSERPLSTYA